MKLKTLVFLALLMTGNVFSMVLENKVDLNGYTSSVLPTEKGFLTEKKVKSKHEWFGMTLAKKFEKALKRYDWGYPSLIPLLEKYYRKEGKSNYSSSWASANFNPLMNHYLFKNKGWNCDGISFGPGEIQELITAFFPWEIGTQFGPQSFYGGKKLDAHGFHEAVHLHLFTGEGILFYNQKTGLFYPILKAKSSFKELRVQELIPYLIPLSSTRKWFGENEKIKGPSVFHSKFFAAYNKEGKKALRVLKFVENSFIIMDKNGGLSLGQIKKKMTESPFFAKVFGEFEGQFKKYKTKKKLKEILNRLRVRYLKNGLYNNSVGLTKGLRIEKVETELILKVPGVYTETKNLKEKLKLTYFLFQRKGEGAFNQKVSKWQGAWKRSILKAIETSKKKKGLFWEKYVQKLKRKMKKEWFLTSLSKKSNYFILGSSWLSRTRPTFLFSVRAMNERAGQMAPKWGQWFFNTWDENNMPEEKIEDLTRGDFYRFIGKGIGLKGIRHLYQNCRHLK
ncbi:hypothetical protein OAK75_09945 [Bacteriovoracales bacterium]|nr:hypothetical protein [Bacteriovoracales bacterium]